MDNGKLFGFIEYPSFLLMNGIEVLGSIDSSGKLVPCVSDPTPPPSCLIEGFVATPPTEGECDRYNYVCTDGVKIVPCSGVGNIGECMKNESQVCESGTKNFWG
ncbi:MAG: hypothetical protein GX421_06795 [Caldisericales bacterium]|nr:hypothetical protein [Caldisericales bacterium]